MDNNKALVIFSGGLDSTTALYWALGKFDDVECMSVDYGQRHRLELHYARQTLMNLVGDEQLTNRIPRHLITSDLTQFGNSALTDDGIEPHFDRRAEDMATGTPNTFVPGRNILMLTYAAMICEIRGIGNIVGGWNILDYSGYADCRPEFLDTMINAINLGMAQGPYKLYYPLIKKTKAEIIKMGIKHNVDYSYALSCYMGKPEPCGRCDSCILRAKGFAEVGIPDPLIVRLAEAAQV